MTRIWIVLALVAAGLGLAGAAMVVWPLGDRVPHVAAQETDIGATQATQPPIARFGEARLIEPAPQITTPVVTDEPAREPAPIRPVPSLLGIVRQDGELTAWLAFDGSPSRAVQLGDEIEGWLLIEISETQLAIEAENRREVLGLFVEP